MEGFGPWLPVEEQASCKTLPFNSLQFSVYICTPPPFPNIEVTLLFLFAFVQPYPVRYADTIVDLGYGHELANYGEYSGAPTKDQTYEYAKTLFNLMTKEKNPEGKILIVGGGIANFTDVAATFTGLIDALKSFQDELKAHHVSH
jgi:hypothetical protein